MQFPESWLREFCSPALDTQELASALTMAGLEVESTAAAAPPFSGVVVGEIVSCTQHPNADRLRVCAVDIGGVRLLNIVCGAPNARTGLRVPVAKVGAELPPGDDGKPLLIRLGQLRGVESQGMLCSASELKISDASSGLYELPSGSPLGQDLREFLQLDDTLFTLKLTPNLGHCLSVHGVAREVAAITGASLLAPRFSPVAADHADTLPVTISAPDLCGRFSGRIVRGVNTRAKTPQWMIDRLTRCGQRSVSALVDISNYVMFEYGRPSHIFDLDKIHGGLDVRWGRAGETLKLLNGSTVTVDQAVGVIADARAVESLAGIMGGDGTSVTDDTKNIYIEAAFWWPEAVAGRSRRFNFSTDAGHRFERGVDPSTTVEHLERITQLVLDICGGSVGPVDDQQVNLPVRAPLTLRVARASKVIGMPVTAAQCLDAFKRLGLPASEADGLITVQPPAYRFDQSIEEDLIEEVVRLIGFNLLPATAPVSTVEPRARSDTQRGRFALRRQLAGLGYQETINFSFVDERWERELASNPEPVRLLNPIASQMSVMRSTLAGSLIQVLKHNLDRKVGRLRVFEVGRVFWRDASAQAGEGRVPGLAQPMRIAALAYGSAAPLQWSPGSGKDRLVDFFDLKADIEALLAPVVAEFRPASHPALHPGRCAEIYVGGSCIGFAGELHPRWCQGYELPQAPQIFELDLAAVLERQLPTAQAVSKRQPVERDLAVIVSERASHADLMAATYGADTEGLLKSATLFDVYRPQPPATALLEGEKSLAIRLVFADDDAPLTDEQIEAAVKSVLVSLQQRLQARLRT
ncbi:MAG: phenylalanine--tRNA ligase subunit beta [Polaromonas sp.]|nr:phenylalanine--tRNA ligase subunit beta [Polaromonas sp.]